MMVESKNYKGIEYVQISELPEPQRAKILDTISHELLIKILIDGVIVRDCVQYKDYSFWFNNIYKTPAVQTAPEPTQALPGFQPKLVFKS